jgi:L-amino acid N-acyltransferase YncA
VNVRLASARDAEHVRAIYAPYVTDSYVSFETTLPSISEMRTRITESREHHPWLVAEESSRVVGFAHAGQHRARAGYRWSVESSVYVDTAYHRRGAAKELYVELLALLKLQRYHAVFAGIALPNDASVAFHRAMGFRPVGVFREIGFKLGAWRDTSWWQIRLSPSDVPAGEPLSISDVLDSA